MPVQVGGVGERSNPTDCNSVAKASKVRILPPPPLFPTRLPMRVWFSGRTSAFQADGAGSIPATRSIILQVTCSCSSGVEHFLGKEEVVGSIPAKSSIFKPLEINGFRGFCLRIQIFLQNKICVFCAFWAKNA